MDPFLLAAIIPIKSYSNAEADKGKILSDNQNKSGIYMWTNNINKKRYIGSSTNLRRRFREYFNINYLLQNNSMYICNSLLKHDYCNFSLTILEYCSPDKCLEREGYYLKLFKPEYNISQDPTAPFSGRKHSDKSKTIMSDAKKGEKNPNFAKTGENHPNYGQTLNEETIKKISDAMVGNTNSKNQPNSQQIQVFDEKLIKQLLTILFVKLPER